MFNKKFMMLAILLVGLLTISAVNAEDNATSDVACEGMDESADLSSVDESVMDSAQDEDLGVESSDLNIDDSDSNTVEEKLSDSNGVRNFSLIWEAIDHGDHGHPITQTVELGGYYITDGSRIDYQGRYDGDTIIINGNGAILDGNGTDVDIFWFWTCNVVLNNINFVNDSLAVGVYNCSLTVNNCRFENSGGIGSSIEPSKCQVNSCTFVNCSRGYGRGAISFSDGDHYVRDCSFTDCSVTSEGQGGAIYIDGGNCSLSGCSFVRCSVKYGDGGAISVISGDCNVDSSSFKDCLVDWYGGAIFFSGAGYGSVKSCNFENCYSQRDGGAIFGPDSVVDCSFIKCSADEGDGGAILSDNCSIRGCSFEKCSSGVYGGAIACEGNVSIIDCSFLNCSSNMGGAMRCIGNVKISDSVFNRCSGMEGGAIHYFKIDYPDRDNSTDLGLLIDDCSFMDCSASDYGGAVYYYFSSLSNRVSTVIDNSTFRNCHADKDGGAVCYSPDFSEANCFIRNSKFVDCSANDYGGGIYFSSKDSAMLNCYFEGNSANNGSDWYSEFDINNTITIVSTSIAASKVTATYGVSKKLVITLKDENGNALDSKPVTVNVGTISKTLTTNDKGQASLDVSTLVPDTYVATVKFAGDDKYKASSTTADVKVNKANPKLTAKAKSFKRSDKTKKYTITLKDNKNKVMKNTKVTLKVNKKTYTAKTNSKGVATFKLTKLTKKGKYTATVKYAGSKYYNAKTAKPKITVK